MADEYLQQQAEVTEPSEDMILLIVQPGPVNPEDNVPRYVTLKNLRVASRIFLKMDDGRYVELKAGNDANPVVWQIHDELPA